MLREVREGRLDLGLVIGPAKDESLAGIRLKALTVYVSAPARWRAEIARCGWEHVLRGPWVVGHEDSFCGQAARAQARAATRLVEVDHPGAVLELVSAGVCAGILHDEDALAAEAAGKVLLWRERPLSTELWAVWNRARLRRSAAAAMVPILRRIWRG